MTAAPKDQPGREALAILIVRLISPDGSAFRDRDLEDEIQACFYFAAKEELIREHGSELLNQAPIADWYDDDRAARWLIPLAMSENGKAARIAIDRMRGQFAKQRVAGPQPAIAAYIDRRDLDGLPKLRPGRRVTRDSSDLAVAVAVAILENLGVTASRGETLRGLDPPNCGCALIPMALNAAFDIPLSEENATDIWWANRTVACEIAPDYIDRLKAYALQSSMGGN